MTAQQDSLMEEAEDGGTWSLKDKFKACGNSIKGLKKNY